MWWIILAVLFIVFDLNYFIRVIFTLIVILCSKRGLKLSDTITTYGICTTQDIDMMLNHMNNARFLRELDFARYHWYGRTGFWTKLRALGGSAVQASAMIRYRKLISLGHPFRIETNMVWWDEKCIFFEHKFITLFDGFVRAVATSRQAITGVELDAVLRQFEDGRTKPEQPEEIRHWMSAVEVSSRKLRKDR
ncbi:AAEL014811-PA [Aedes aegypti]|uniref:Protein THEM6 n=1 Tax=Aedes aegypti TaxID=7159 RepID=Q16FD4_AEDAE|nr:AAEL014811-PA [Aedes aegypti]